MTRFLWLALIGLAVSGSAPAAESDDVKAFDTALAAGRYSDAVKAYGRVFDARLPRDGTPKADALLDAMVGSFYLASGNAINAQAFLKSAAAVDGPVDPTLALNIADAALLIGDYDSAEAAYARLAQTLTGDQKTRAIIGQAQSMLMTRPSEVSSLIANVTTTNPSLMWRISVLDAQQALIRKDFKSAQTAADRAMLQANHAPLRNFAPRQALQLQAAVAAAQNDRDRVTALLAAIPSSSSVSSELASAIARRLPKCGRDGITEDDNVVIGLFTQSTSSVAVPVPLAASRVEIVGTFMRSIAGFSRDGLNVGLAAYPIMTVRCTNTDPIFFYDDSARFAQTQWFAKNHIRPRFLDFEVLYSDDPLTEAGRIFDKIEQDVGSDSSILIPLLNDLAGLTIARLSEKADVPNSRIPELSSRADRLTKAAGGVPVNIHTDDATGTAIETLAQVKSLLSDMPIEYAYSAALDILSSDNNSIDDKLSISEIMTRRLGRDVKNRRAATMVNQNIDFLHQSDRGKDAEALSKAVKFDPAFCQSKATRPKVIDSGLTAEDYPTDAIAAELNGGTFVELDIGTDQKIIRLRQVVQAPPLVFEDTLNRVSAMMRYIPAKDGQGRDVVCTAYHQRIRWNLPEQ